MCPCDVISEREGVDGTREHEVSDTNWNLYVVNIKSYIRINWGREVGMRAGRRGEGGREEQRERDTFSRKEREKEGK